jgi:tetratricopeptide (TPR) repeat protein
MDEVVRLSDFARDEHSRGNFRAAEAYWIQVIALQPAERRYYGSRAAALEPQGRLDEALADWDRAISNCPEDAVLLQRRGDLRMHLEKFEGAFADFDHAASVDPGNTLYLDRRELAGQKLSAKRTIASQAPVGPHCRLTGASFLMGEPGNPYLL